MQEPFPYNIYKKDHKNGNRHAMIRKSTYCGTYRELGGWKQAEEAIWNGPWSIKPNLQ